MASIGLLTEYEQIMLKKRKDFSPAYMGTRTLQKEVVDLLRFVFEELLQWKPDIIRDYVTPELMLALHLKKPLNKIEFPPELNKKQDLFYLAWMLYPETVNCTKTTLTLRVYQKVLDGKLMKFPKCFFSEAEGDLNASICLQQAISQHLHFKDIKELYLIFANHIRVTEFLKESRLYSACTENYEYPIDMLHVSLAESQKSELYYYFGRFQADLDACKRRECEG